MPFRFCFIVLVTVYSMAVTDAQVDPGFFERSSYNNGIIITDRENNNDNDSNNPTTPIDTSQGFQSKHTTSAPSTEGDSSSNNPATATPPSTSYTPLFLYLCPQGFVRLSSGCYYFSSDMASWRAAHFACRELGESEAGGRGGQLVALETPWEEKVLRRHLSRPEMARLNRWLGGIYDWHQEAWVWGGSGEVMQYRGFPGSASANKPYSPQWQCTYASPALHYSWSFAKCTREMHYVCEAPFRRVSRWGRGG